MRVHSGYISEDGLTKYRPPMIKKQSINKGQAHANYEARVADDKPFTFNAHVTVTDISEYNIDK